MSIPAGLAAENTKSGENKVLKILAIGNSFSEDATRWLYQIAENCGADEIIIGNLYWGGCSLSQHWSNANTNYAGYDYQKNTNGSWTHRNNSTMEYAIKDEDWDYITLQQVSGYSGVEDTYNSDLDNLVNYVNSNKTNPNAKLGWHMTWAYQQNSNHGDFSKYNKDQMTMYNAILSATQNKIVASGKFDFVIPSGTAVQNMRTSYVGDTLTRDGYHLSYNLGRYIAGLTWLKTVTGWSVDDVIYVPDMAEVPQSYLPIIKEAVNNAVAHPYQVTASSYAEKGDEDIPAGYEKLDIEFGGIGYWNSGSGGYSANPTVNSIADNSKNFIYSVKRFTKEDIPAGSIIEIDSGWQYRPDGWGYSGTGNQGRPGNITTAQVKIDDSYWTKYEYRAFNIALVGNNTSLIGREAEAASHFRVYVPTPDYEEKSSAKTIEEVKINGVKGKLAGNMFTVPLPEDTDITSLIPEIKISDKASVTPAGAQNFTKPVTYTVTAEDGSQQSYIIKILPEKVYDYTGYDLLEVEFGETTGYWGSFGHYYEDPYSVLSIGDPKFVYTKKLFTKEDIPVGSVIVIDPGYQFRPEGFGYESNPNPGRPDNVTGRLVVDESWWTNYEYRSFNIAEEGATTDITNRQAEVASHFRIYIPKKDIGLRINISDGVSTAGDTSGKLNITWNANVTLENTTLEEINSIATFKDYGVYYGTSEAEVMKLANGRDTAMAKKLSFASGGGNDIDVYTVFGFRLKGVPESRSRAAMFYVTYEVDGQLTTVYSSVSEAIVE